MPYILDNIWHYNYLMEPSIEYVAFEEKVKKTIYIDNLSPQVTKAVLESAINQFGNVKDVQFVPTYSRLAVFVLRWWRWNQPNRLKKSSVRWVILLL
ncbi:putative nucleotide-binding alpha-beta plait domain superfamily, RNA-binding domain superfamily [Helianthus anomalus]